MLGILLIMCLYGYQKSYAYRVSVTLINKTQEKVNYLYLSYTGCETDLAVPPVDGNQKITFRPKIIFEHDIYCMDIWIYYRDDNGKMHKKKIVKDYDYTIKLRGLVKCTVIIESVDENGKIELVCQ